MRRSIYSFGIVFGLAGFALQALGQTTATPAKCKIMPPTLQVYTAEFKVTQVQTLANGTTITHESTRTQAKDSQGRFMSTFTHQNGEQAPVTSVHVEDPVAGTRIDWNSQQKKATVVKLPPMDERHGCWASEAGRLRINYSPEKTGGAGGSGPALESVSSAGSVAPAYAREKPIYEDLGTTTILGIEARGQRSTITTPEGAIGNDQPLVTTTDNWNATSTRLPFTLRHISDSPRQGKEDRELVKLDQGEPDPALFQPPEGYEVVNDQMVPCKE